MKTLLVFPRRNPFDDGWVPEDPPVPPLGICYLGAVIERAGLPIELLDCTVAHKGEITAKIDRADVVGFSAMTYFAEDVLQLIEYAKGLGKTVIVGGPHATVSPEFFLKKGYADLVVRCEGENTLLEALQVLEKGGSWSWVKGISYLAGDAVKHTPERDFIRNLDELPFPARYLLPMERYVKVWRRKVGRVKLPLFTSRGCPYGCIFCAKEIFGRVYRVRSPKNVVDEVVELISQYNADEVIFNDDVFTLNKGHVLQICNEIKSRKLDVEWSCEGRVDRVDEEMLKSMKEAGCRTISYGIESGSPSILKTLNKQTTVEQIERATRLTKDAGIYVRFYIILGSPGETLEDVNLTRKLIAKTKPDYIDITTFTPLPGTEAYELLKDKLLIDKGTFTYRGGLIFKHDNFSDEELQKIKADIKREFRSQLILRTLTSPKRIIESLRNIQEARSLLRSLKER